MSDTIQRAVSAAPTLFAFGNQRVRVLTDAAGEPWFVAADVCRILGIQNTTDAIADLDSDDRDTLVLNEGIPGNPNKNVVNESGLYQLIFASRKPEAKEFKRWVTKEVLPALRKTGSYSVSAPALPTTYKDALKALVAEIEAKEVLALENAELRPKAEFFDAVTASDDTLGMNEAAKLIGMGRNKVMAALRHQHVFRANNTPYQQFIDAGYFKVVESTWADRDGANHVQLSTRVFQRGVEFIRKKLSSK